MSKINRMFLVLMLVFILLPINPVIGNTKSKNVTVGELSLLLPAGWTGENGLFFSGPQEHPSSLVWITSTQLSQGQTLRKYAEEEISKRKDKAKRHQMTIDLSLGDEYELWYMEGEQPEINEEVAFVRVGKHIYDISFQCKDQSSREKHRNEFLQLLSSLSVNK